MPLSPSGAAFLLLVVVVLVAAAVAARATQFWHNEGTMAGGLGRVLTQENKEGHGCSRCRTWCTRWGEVDGGAALKMTQAVKYTARTYREGDTRGSRSGCSPTGRRGCSETWMPRVDGVWIEGDQLCDAGVKYGRRKVPDERARFGKPGHRHGGACVWHRVEIQASWKKEATATGFYKIVLRVGLCGQRVGGTIMDTRAHAGHTRQVWYDQVAAGSEFKDADPDGWGASSSSPPSWSVEMNSDTSFEAQHPWQ
ncbi:polysaccharide lyase [Biscogniauxia mediterranea]|nr:polysaccharide lyase [Biscogniauxia mediterranea]